MSFSKPLHSMSWAGKDYTPNSLTSKRKFNPKLPSLPVEENADVELVYKDYPEGLRKRLDDKTQMISVDCLKENTISILKFFEEDIIEHVLGNQMQNKGLRKLIMAVHFI